MDNELITRWRRVDDSGGELTTFLLPLSRLVVLKPVENVFAFDFSKPPEFGCDLLNLLRRRSSDSASVHFLKRLQLLRRRVPPRAHQRHLSLVMMMISCSNMVNLRLLNLKKMKQLSGLLLT